MFMTYNRVRTTCSRSAPAIMRADSIFFSACFVCAHASPIPTPRDEPSQSAIETSALSLPHECLSVRFEAGIVVRALDHDACRKAGIETGMSTIDVDQRLGKPSESWWQYSWSPG